MVITEGAILDERIADSFAARYNGYPTQSRGFFILARVAFAWSHYNGLLSVYL